MTRAKKYLGSRAVGRCYHRGRNIRADNDAGVPHDRQSRARGFA